MALEIKQNLKLSQSLVITPQLQQAIKLLQLSQIELVELVQEEMLENPMLEENLEDVARQEAPELAAEHNESELPLDTNHNHENLEVGGREGDFKEEPSDFDWDNYLNTYNAPENIQNRMEELPSYENTLANKTSLFDHLNWQLQLSDFDEHETEIGTLLIGCINDDGYLQEPLEDIAAKASAGLEEVFQVLKMIQEFDPPGVGARNLQECLKIQIRLLGKGAERELLTRMVENHLSSLERKDYLRIAKDLKISLEKVQTLAKLIHELEPKPGREYGSSEAQYITPDVYVSKIGDEWVVVLNEDGLPKLKVSHLYRNNMSGSGATKEYVQNKLRAALWLIRSIHQRQRTLYRTAKTIVKFQQEFFEKGLNYLKPMILRDVASEIEMHESTVSRVTTNKYMHTP
ncbi:MAG TPA: RNA polymerase sigma-54 factor, partial [Deltaproteobacteria bacterium]|nr:RNA polymerase sigma-54 factor [Deltaproteobacteria bacterium]